MLRPLALALLVSVSSASAQSLSDTDVLFRSDLELVARVAATAALVHDQTGAFPSDAFDLMGSHWAAETGLRSASLSSISVSPEGEAVRVRYNPLPRPYVSDDLLADVTIVRDEDGTYTARHALQRRTDPDRGARALPYDRAGRYRVDRAGGTLCVDLAVVRELLAGDGDFQDALPDLDGDGVPVQVTTLDGREEVVFTSGRPSRDA